MLPAARKTAVVGTGFSEVSRRAAVGVGSLAAEACRRAIAEAGLRVRDIDGIATYPNPSRVGAGNTDGVDFVDVGYIARALDLKQLRWHCSVTQGTVTAALIQAVNAVAAGACDYALVWRAMHNPPNFHNVLPATRAPGASQFNAPYGLSGPAPFALPYARYLAKYGATREHLATFVVNNRRNATLNPEAIFRDQPISREDYLNSRMIAEPLSLLDCDMYVDGCGAVVVTTAERARDLRLPPAYVAGYAQNMGYDHAPVMKLESGYENGRRFAKTLWESSGLRPEDVDHANVYDGYSYFIYVWLEYLGFCKEGEAFAFIQDGRIELGGPFPLNTSSGNLGMGRLHGTPHLIEAVRQIMGCCGPRQVKDPAVTLAVVGTPFPMPGASAGGLVFTREP
jgi:acetyl-CoA acetyltransferase